MSYDTSISFPIPRMFAFPWCKSCSGVASQPSGVEVETVLYRPPETLGARDHLECGRTSHGSGEVDGIGGGHDPENESPPRGDGNGL